MMIVAPGEKIHLIERRLFAEDVRRHFAGVVDAASSSAVRLRGYLFVYDTGTNAFLKKSELRVRIVNLDNRVIVNVLPADVELEDLRYDHDSDGNLSIVDGRGFELDISEFSPRE